MEAITEVYESGWSGHDLLYVQAQNLEMLWQDFSHKLGDQVLIPLNTYTNQFPEVRVSFKMKNNLFNSELLKLSCTVNKPGFHFVRLLSEIGFYKNLNNRKIDQCGYCHNVGLLNEELVAVRIYFKLNIYLQKTQTEPLGL